MTYTSEQIELIDKISNYYYDYYKGYCRTDNPSDDLFSEKYEIDRDKAQWAINMFCKIGDELGILKASKSRYGLYNVVNMDLIEFENFKSEGGFKKYFSDIVKPYAAPSNIVMSNSGTIIQTGRDANVGDKATKQIQDSYNVKSQRSKPLLEKILYNPWIVTVIGGLIIAYLVYKFGWIN